MRPNASGSNPVHHRGDLTMSIDNILASRAPRKGTSGHHIRAGVDIPLVVFSSNLLSRLIGSLPSPDLHLAPDCWEGGRRNASDRPVTVQIWHPTTLVRYCVEGRFVIAVDCGGQDHLPKK